MAVFILSRMRTVHSHTICHNKSFCLIFLPQQILTQKFILLNYLYSYNANQKRVVLGKQIKIFEIVHVYIEKFLMKLTPQDEGFHYFKN